MRLISASSGPERAHAAAAHRPAARVEHDERRALLLEHAVGGEDRLLGHEARPEPLAHERQVLVEERPRGRAGGGLVAQLELRRAPQREHDDVVVEHRRPLLRLGEDALGERLRRHRAAELGQQLRQPRVAEEGAVAARLEQPVGRREQRRRRARSRPRAPRGGRPPRRPAAARAPASSSLPPSARSRHGRRVARVAVAQPAVGRRCARKAVAKPPRWQAHAQDAVGLREHLGRALGVPRARLDEEAHHRARRRDLEALAADVADQQRHRAARLGPDAEDVAAADLVRDRLVDEAELEPGLRVGRAREVAARERAGDPALVLELERVRDRAGRADAERGQPPQVRLPEAPGHLVHRAEDAEQPPAERDRDVHERAHALRLDDPAHEAVAVVGLSTRTARPTPRRARSCPRRA